MYEWDEVKRLVNLRKHGVDFAAVEDFAWEYSLTEEDAVVGYGEQRMVSIGPIGLRIHVLVWTGRGDRIRVISLRLATRAERRRHEQEF